jgi:GntR family transcriptional regulator
MTESIERGESPYRQIARYYREKIERGELQPGELLPSVRAMADRWQVAHTTANRALRTLQAEGLVQSTTGLGTVVAPTAPTAESLIANLRQSGSFYPPGYRSVITGAWTIPATTQVADALALESGDPVVARSRITYDANDIPIEMSTNYVRGEFAAVAPALLVTEPIPNGMLGYLEAQTGRQALHGCDQYAAFPATIDQAAALQISAGDPVLIERHWWTDAEGTILDYAESVEPGERWRTRRYQIGTTSPTK